MGEIDALNIRRGELISIQEFCFTVQPVYNTILSSSCPPGPLDRRGLADPLNFQRGHPTPGGMGRDFSKPGINHAGHPGDGDRSFSHIGGEDDLALPLFLEHPLLFLQR